MKRRATIALSLCLLGLTMWTAGNDAKAKSSISPPGPFVVLNNSDADPGSLRAAVASANTTAGADTIEFDPAFFSTPRTITLTSGELVIKEDLTIIGPGASFLTISGNNSSRVFFINPGANGTTVQPAGPFPVVSISNLTIANGKAKGGNGGPAVSGGGGGAAGMGGAIFANGGTLTIDHVTFSDNHAIGGNGGSPSGSGDSCGGGGGGTGSDGVSSGSVGGTGGNGGALGGLGGAGSSSVADGDPGGEGAGGGGGSNTGDDPQYSGGGTGGFGAGGGGGGLGVGAPGGFGGGAGGGGSVPGGSFGGHGGSLGGGGGAGLGGAIFMRLGSLNLVDSDLTANSASGGNAGTGGGVAAASGQGKGGALFVTVDATANICSTTFTSNTAANTADTATDNDDFYGIITADCGGTECSRGNPPAMSCPANVTMFATSLSGAVVNYTTPACTDCVCPNPTTEQTAGKASGSTFPIGVTVNTFKVTDGGQTSTCTFSVTVTVLTCPLGKGHWKNHAWPVSSMILGDESYTKSELMKLISGPVTGDASSILAQHLIAAKLNIANGSDPSPVSAAIASADALLASFNGKLPYKVKPSSAIGQQMTALASLLDQYNSGLLPTFCSP